MMQFDVNQDESSIIKVIGVGGGGTNAVNHMYQQGIKGVDFIVCNTDQQSLDASPVPTKIVLGESLTKGRGAGSIPEVGKNAAIESIDQVQALLETNTEMLFVTAGLGGGTGTGAAPIIANIAKELGILTVGIITIPFGFEGKKRMFYANEGLAELKENLDTLLIINNDKLRDIYGNLKMREAFAHADDIVATAARGIAEIITTTLQINTDINDVKTVMKDSGVAIMGSAQASGDDRAMKAVEQALTSPLLNDNNINGARYVLVNVMCGEDDNELTMDEFGDIADYIQDAAGMSAEIIKGYGIKADLEDTVSITVIATGFNLDNETENVTATFSDKAPAKKVFKLEDEPKAEEKTTAEATPEKKTTHVDEMTLSVKEPEIQSTPTVSNSPITQPEETVFPKAEIDEKPATFEFELRTKTTPTSTTPTEPVVTNSAKNQEDLLQSNTQLSRSQERISKLKDLSFKVKSQGGLAELEDVPAFRRKQIDLAPTPHSSESQVSRFSLSADDDETENKSASLNGNNSFLHDNVD